MRLFVAVNFEPRIKTYLLRIQQIIREAARSGSFTHPDNLHLTLVFIGEADRSQLMSITRVLDGIHSPRFDLTFTETGTFGRGGTDLWWVGLQSDRVLYDLQKNLAESLRAIGCRADDKPFVPHITIARKVALRNKADRDRLAIPLDPVSTTVAAVSLMQSLRIDGQLTYVQLHVKRLEPRLGSIAATDA